VTEDANGRRAIGGEGVIHGDHVVTHVHEPAVPARGVVISLRGDVCRRAASRG
jgi:hypothetical protein